MHTAAVALSVGHTGAWIGPLVVGLAAGALDYSAAGPAALRDRIAVAGYYASALSFVTLLGLAGWERSVISSYDWRMAGAVASLATHGALLLAMFGGRLAWTRGLSAALATKIKLGGEASKATKINGTLAGWATAAAITAPLSGNGGWGRVVDAIGTWSTSGASAVLRGLFAWLGA